MAGRRVSGDQGRQPGNDKLVTVHFDVDNVFDNNYWTTGRTSLVFPGMPRIYRLSATFRF